MPLTTIGTAAIDDNAITTAKIAADTVVAADIAANSIDSSELIDGSIDTSHIAAAQITLAKMAVNSIDSDQYVDGSIDLAHMSVNSIDSDQYVDGSIDLAHMSVNSIDSDQYVDGSIDTVHIADNQVTLAKMAGLVRGKIIIGDASGDPSALTVGTADQVLTSDGTDAAWTDAAGGITWLAVVTGATTMAAGNGYFVNTTSSAFSMTLPASASRGDEVHIIDYAGTFDTNNCTVARNSHKIQGATSDLVVGTERAAFKLVYVDATQGWLLTEL